MGIILTGRFHVSFVIQLLFNGLKTEYLGTIQSSKNSICDFPDLPDAQGESGVRKWIVRITFLVVLPVLL
jgi:hypothetical protein